MKNVQIAFGKEITVNKEHNIVRLPRDRQTPSEKYTNGWRTMGSIVDYDNNGVYVDFSVDAFFSNGFYGYIPYSNFNLRNAGDSKNIADHVRKTVFVRIDGMDEKNRLYICSCSTI